MLYKLKCKWVGCGKDFLSLSREQAYCNYICEQNKDIVEKRLWGKLVHNIDNDCWEWDGEKTDKGYGRLRYKGKVYRAHRLAYKLTYGELPKGLLVCHKCDNRLCCNPKHLFLENAQDAVKKGRMARGRVKLIEAKVLLILKMFERGDSKRSLARVFNVRVGSIRNIISGKSWKHVPR